MRNALIGLALVLLLSGCMTDEQVAQKAAYDNRPQLGAAFEPEWWSENTVVIRDVGEDTAAERAGLKNRDQIISWDGKPVTDLDSLRALELDSRHGQTVILGVIRDGHAVRAEAELQ
jgi:S1-C subfamily serine protease